MSKSLDVRAKIAKMDNLGRIVIPIDMRRKMDVDHQSQLYIHFENNSVIIKKFEEDEPKCIVCESRKNLLTEKLGMPICKSCAQKITSSLQSID